VAALTYQLLDELELAYADDNLNGPNVELAVQSLGPLIQLQRSSARDAISSGSRIAYGSFSDAADFVLAPKGLYLNSSKSIGIASAKDRGSADELMQLALLAINRARFPRVSAAQAISALGELESNIHEHSEDRVAGVIAFEVHERFVGIYASDRGIGVLESLRRNPLFASLEDTGSALRMALREGVSSSGERGRGMGFRPIFVGLASLAALLRFRSGDTLLEINGYGDRGPTEHLRERTYMTGFHAFVHCTFSR
jgi:anti-sigma regulatory factor (Ser/Thr protein kinase)